MQIDYFFPTAIASVINPEHFSLQQKMVNRCLSLQKNIESGGQGWVSKDTYNTSNNKHDIYTDKEFEHLNIWVENQVKKYASELGYHTNMSSTGAWFNIYQQYDYQEVHVHPGSAISAIYILSAPPDSARVFMMSPIANMYMSMDVNNHNQNNISQIYCNSEPGTLIIFPSYLPHAVERHKLKEIRVSLSYNFRRN